MGVEDEKRFSLYALALLGSMSGDAVLKKSSTKGRLLISYNVLVVMALMVRLILVPFYAFNPLDSTLVFLNKLMNMGWNVMTVLNIWCFLWVAHRKNDLYNFNLAIEDIATQMKKMSVKFKHRKRQKYIIVTVAMAALVYSCINMILITLDFVDDKVMDSIFGVNILNQTESSIELAGLQSYGFITQILTTFHFPFHMAVYVSTMYQLKQMFGAFNEHIKLLSETQPRALLNHICQYRLLHLELCTLADDADSLLCVFSASVVGSYSGIFLLALYIIIKVPGIGGAQLFTYFYWILTGVLVILPIIFFSDTISEQVRRLLMQLIGFSILSFTLSRLFYPWDPIIRSNQLTL